MRTPGTQPVHRVPRGAVLFAAPDVAAHQLVRASTPFKVVLVSPWAERYGADGSARGALAEQQPLQDFPRLHCCFVAPGSPGPEWERNADGMRLGLLSILPQTGILRRVCV